MVNKKVEERKESFFMKYGMYIGMGIMFAVPMIAVLLLSYDVATQPTTEEIKKEQTLQCTQDCESLGQEYFKFDYSPGRFGPSIRDCFCNNKGSVEQIW